ncbi:midasin [Strongylocentrotus purpuratus]|uniref:Uncharacterized protein n=1 Tax=Strongylocentrotus purpuratus TaxID=7668 RepID=A0A7M7GIJ0_STRPU|nr:midasin [Strongylocentrotus purpuratus]XP_011664338.1 midasin [Strongylocentrotus purpuratus]|eukprot:XP_003729579.1 PREDICTED: midasin [Strongylocentrotus purpuratus]
MEAEAQPSVVDGSEVKDEVKGEEVTDDVEVTLEQRVSGDEDVKTAEDAGVSEDQTTLQGDKGAGDSHPNEETEITAEQAERDIHVDGNEREGERDDANDEGETEVKSEDKLEQGEIHIADELRRSRKEDEGDEVVSSKVTTVSFASEVQVLNEDELEEQWTPTGGDDDGGVDADKGDDDTGGIVEPEDNKTEAVGSSTNMARAEDRHHSEEEVSAAQDSNELESIPGATPQAGEQEQSDLDTAENVASMEEAVPDVEKASEEVDIVTTEQGQAVEEEQPLPETAPSGDARVVTAEQNLEAKQGEEDGDEIFDDIPVLQAMEETRKETVHEYEEVVHRSVNSSAPQITLEATVEDNTEQVIAEVEGTEEGEETETHENVPVLQSEEVEAENAFVEAEAGLLAGAPEDVVEATVMEEATSQEHHESGSQEAEDNVLGVEVHMDGNGDQQEKLDDGKDGAVDSHIELHTDDALQDENTNFEENQDENYTRDLTYPSESIPYETDPNLSSVNQEDDPTTGNYSEYQQQQPILASDFDPLPPIEPEMVRHDILQLQEERRIEGLSPIELLTQANQAHGILPSPLRSPHHQQHPRSGSNSKLESMSRATSLSMVQIARIPSPPAHVKAQMMIDEERRASTRTSSRLPPSVMKMSSVMVNARKKAVKNRDASVYYEERQFHKTIGLDEAINSRPPMPFDLDTPGPCLYSPRNKPLYEDNAPEYSFGMKFPERAGGGRTAYSKTWFNSNDNYTVKTRFERRWPSPNAYGKGRSMVGRKVPDKKDYPSFSMRGKTNFIINKRGSENEPGPDQYHRQRSDPLLFRRAPAFSMGAKLDRGRLFGAPEITPAPNYYNPHTKYTSRKVTYPAFTISGIRKPKSHALGPHATL